MSESTLSSTVPDSAADDLFGKDVPVELWGPIVNRDTLALGMVCRFIRTDKLGRDRKTVHVFQLDTAAAECFTLWGTAVLNGKLRQVKKGAPILLRYMGQDEDEDRTHQWTVKPFVGSGKEWGALLRSAKWAPLLDAMQKVIADAARLERQRRASQGDGAPPHDDHDAPDGFGRDLRAR